MTGQMSDVFLHVQSSHGNFSWGVLVRSSFQCASLRLYTITRKLNFPKVGHTMSRTSPCIRVHVHDGLDVAEVWHPEPEHRAS